MGGAGLSAPPLGRPPVAPPRRRTASDPGPGLEGGGGRGGRGAGGRGAPSCAPGGARPRRPPALSFSRPSLRGARPRSLFGAETPLTSEPLGSPLPRTARPPGAADGASAAQPSLAGPPPALPAACPSSPGAPRPPAAARRQPRRNRRARRAPLRRARPRAPEAVGTMLRVLVGAVLPVMVLAAPPPINKLALFPDKSAWCEAKNITQIVGHSGCEAKSIQNRACLGQCFSYSVPNTFPQSTESLVHCDSCMPAQSMWEIVTLECPGHEEVPRVDKLVEKILHCSCQACGKEPSHEGLSVYVQGEDAQGAQPGAHPHPHPGGQAPEPEDPPGAPHAEEEGAED
ncbi:hypothetical protein AB1E18_000851 [Capra hircus]